MLSEHRWPASLGGVGSVGNARLQGTEEVSAVERHAALDTRQLLLVGHIVPAHVVRVQCSQLLLGEVTYEAALLLNATVDVFPLLLEMRIRANVADARARAPASANLRQIRLSALCILFIF